VKKISFALVAVLTLGLVSVSPAVSAEVEDEQIPSAMASLPGFHGLELNEVSGLRNNVSVLMTETPTGTKMCTSATAAPCDGASRYDFKAVLGPCSSTVTVDCIESVSSIASDGTPTAGVFKEYFPANAPNAYTGSPTEGVPSGKSPSMWTFANLPHAFGSDYQVTVETTGMKTNGDALKPLRTFFANITPVSLFQTTCTTQSNGTCLDQYKETAGSDGKTKLNFAGVAADQDAGYRCHNWGENAMCALKRAFPANARFAIKVRLTTTPTGWLHGRMKNPKASIVRADNVTTVSIEADPVKVPTVSAGALFGSLPANIQQWFNDNCSSSCGTRIPESRTLPGPQRNAISNPSAFSDAAFSQLKLWTEYIKDKATAIPSVWNVRTLSYNEMVKAPKCISEGTGVTGIVATNSTLYAEGPPAFDTATSALNYKVAAPHYEKDGTTEFKGTYDLVLRTDIAKCLYGFDDATSTAKIEVSDENGTAKTVTTSMGVADGWFKFSASGFTFSAPTVKVTLIKPASAPIAAPTIVVPSMKKGKTKSVSSVAKAYGLSIPKGARVVVSVSAKSKKVCSVSGNATIRATAKGSCVMKISVTPKATAKVKKPKTTSKTATVKIS
jgi:hypothetical protein